MLQHPPRLKHNHRHHSFWYFTSNHQDRPNRYRMISSSSSSSSITDVKSSSSSSSSQISQPEEVVLVVEETGMDVVHSTSHNIQRLTSDTADIILEPHATTPSPSSQDTAITTESDTTITTNDNNNNTTDRNNEYIDHRPIIRTPLLPPLPRQIAEQYNHVPMPPNDDYTTYNPQSLAYYGRILQTLEIVPSHISTTFVPPPPPPPHDDETQHPPHQNTNPTTTTSSSSSPPSSTTTATTSTTIRTSSSGQNSYLKINLFKRPYLEGLYNATASIQGRLDTALQKYRDKGNGPPLQQLPNIYFSKRFRKTRTYKLKHTIPDTNGRMRPQTLSDIQHKEKVVVPPLEIIPRPLSSLHCTLFFGGPVLVSEECMDEELIYFHDKISQRLARSGFIGPDGSKYKHSYPIHLPDDYWFHVKEFKVFPPRGKYLIVAELQASLAYHRLWNDLHDIARTAMSTWTSTTSPTTKSAIASFMNAPAQKHITRWIPHITVAGIQQAMDGKRVEEKILQKVLKSLSEDHYDNEHADDIENMKCHSITMGGPIPQLKQNTTTDGPAAALNWDYTFRFVRRGIQHFDEDELGLDDDIWGEPHETDPFGIRRKKWLRKKRRLISRGLLDPDFENQSDSDDNDDEKDDSDHNIEELSEDMEAAVDDDGMDEHGKLFDEHPQQHILNVFRGTTKRPGVPVTSRSRVQSK